ncbi:Crp/Fnr family transcriptional regulator [Lacrimispora sp. 210928-DFI.3.58]|uniref:Crp/Fnr family transcriptional regulator n=1 Tax=Lacrimispora sp. 210928-DFI.3.58 TaxID=2883214 RepID=UPI001D093BB0|nr:Crp/Fnr family transcriptional regulator [Lacrimispora sp. 210928-DFI.3.58]
MYNNSIKLVGNTTKKGKNMEEYLHLMKKSPLFYGINEDELYTLFKCCGAERTMYETGEYVFRMGESLDRVMILLKGKAAVVHEDFWGKKEELYCIREGEVFGETYSCARTPVLPVSVAAKEGCEVLFLNYQRMITFCSLACDFHTRLIHNLLRLVSEQNVRLENKLEHISRKTTREKILSYLSAQAMSQGGRSFDISHNRQELAEYLCVDRSAMSNELSKMRAEGILDFQRNHFVLYEREKG